MNTQEKINLIGALVPLIDPKRTGETSIWAERIVKEITYALLNPEVGAEEPTQPTEPKKINLNEVESLLNCMGQAFYLLHKSDFGNDTKERWRKSIGYSLEDLEQ